MSIYRKILSYKPVQEQQREQDYAVVKKLVQTFKNNGWDADVKQTNNGSTTRVELTHPALDLARILIWVQLGNGVRWDVLNEGTGSADAIRLDKVEDPVKSFLEGIAGAMYDTGLTERILAL